MFRGFRKGGSSGCEMCPGRVKGGWSGRPGRYTLKAMSLIIPALGGLAGFGLMFIFDWLTARSPSGARKFFWYGGLGLLVVSAVVVFVSGGEPGRLTSAGGLFATLAAAGFLALLVYSLFLELPAATYEGRSPDKVVDRGTWALCRHPGVLWFAGAAGFGALASGSWSVAGVLGLWSVVNGIYAAAQERLFFRHQFSDYGEYAARVPMFIPTAESWARCRATVRKSRK